MSNQLRAALAAALLGAACGEPEERVRATEPSAPVSTAPPSASGGGAGPEAEGSGGAGGSSSGGQAGGGAGAAAEPRCGDGAIDPGEECDDAGASDTCALDCSRAPDELEPNDNLASFQPLPLLPLGSQYRARVVARLASASDVDYFGLALPPSGNAWIVLSDLLRADCADTPSLTVELVDLSGAPVAEATSADGCPELLVGPSGGGIFALRVSAPGASTPPDLGYFVDVTTGYCGNGVVEPGEQCDAGAGEAPAGADTGPADLCSATCE